MNAAGRRVTIIGAGPIGLEAALYARQRGFRVTVLERGTVGSNVRLWGHVRLFSPLAMNVSPWGRAALEGRLPDADSFLTGAEFAEQYLLPLSQHPLLVDGIQENCEVLAIGRAACWKTDLTGSARQESPFVILFRGEQGEEVLESDLVLDCSGTYGNHNWLGAGGIPCPGEASAEGRIIWTLPDVGGRDRPLFEGQRILVAGSGYSAATTVVALDDLASQHSGTSVTWLTRTDQETPIAVIPDDSLSERAELTRRANELAAVQGGAVDWKPHSLVRSIVTEPAGPIEVSLESGGKRSSVTVDRIVALVGYRPDRSIYEELQVHECYATQGPIKLAAALLGESSGDCLTQACPGPETLTSPEPGFFILGAKSYGRSSRFLLRTGIEQIEAVFSLLPEPN